ncbi:MAG TPA: hypothetical protein VMI54_02410 [Polyangiaceae bacterium]|nr:hypothetical protein [Polyangiaceae bacterium]
MSDATRVLVSRRGARAALVAGVLLTLGYFAYVASVPRGPWEFGYAPFSPEPLPYSPMRGFTYEQLWNHVARLGLLAPGLAGLTLGIYGLRPPRFRPSATQVMWLAVAAALGLTAFLMFGVLKGRVIFDDELVYRMQARFYSEGHLASRALPFAPSDMFTIRTRIGYTGKYLPGEGLVQLVGVLTGVPALLHLPLLGVTLAAWHRAVALRAGARFAAFATTALALAPTVAFTSATGLSEPTSLCAVALAGLGLEWARSERPFAGSVVAALAIGFGLATRPQSLFPAAAVLAPCLAFELWRRRAWLPLGVFVLLLGAALAAIGAYDAALSGTPFKLPWSLQCAIEHYGFGRVWKYEAYEHTPLTALENLGVVLVRFNAWWLGLPCSLAVLVAWVWFRLADRRFVVWYAVGVAVVAFEFLYYSPGTSDTGPIYHYELLLPGSLIAASVADAWLARAPALATTAFALHAVLGTLVFDTEQAARVARLVDTIHRDSDAALAQIHRPALLFHEVRGSERRPIGWVFDTFPERNRGQADRVVTFPLVPAPFRALIRAAYPGRDCYYYRRNPDSEKPELHRCEDATALMDRPFAEDDRRGLWIEPTAYRVTPFNPFEANRHRRLFNETGKGVITCCALRELTQYGVKIRPEAAAHCVQDGP